ncbi:MAG TPA: diacylglycerol kinase [Leeuwenhoekiella sp.]|nr:diacylglycerol kinase [Leeuwenhoekiella sp.]HAX16490.1 diacylglycerol kinase [Leeuwenhoekiella sp.]HBO30940.1 diacylglycerol kinase [Leeuwenhoekiella sp.]HCQ76964.1 diacylglycerol kinase [Leeuwenhoekiella sp.]|tara:strand:+ start:82 stop:972 length:891 start_codon:yes stop_codon:yes gene_type:complete
MKTQNTILLVINPIAGGTDKQPIINAFEKHVSIDGNQSFIYETTGDNDKEAIQKLIKEQNPDRIVVSGGDGTIREVADAIKGASIKVGLLPSGSANGLATNFDIPDSLEEQLDIALGDHFIAMDLIEINGYTCLHIADLGINAQLIKNYEKSEIRGKLGYLIQSFPTLLSSDFPFEVEIQCDDQTISEEGILVAIANANKFGTGAQINPTGKMDDGIFEVLVFKNFSIKGILETFYDDAELDPDFVKVIPCKNVSIQSRKPIAFQIDGEFIGDEQRVEAKMTPHKLNLAIPKSFRA